MLTPRLQGRNSPAWWTLGLGLLGLGLFVGFTLSQEHKQEQHEELQRLQGQVQSVSDNLGLQLGGLNRALEDIVEGVGEARPDSLARLLAVSSRAIPSISELLLFDAHGTVVSSSGSRPGLSRELRDLFPVPFASMRTGALYFSSTPVLPRTTAVARVFRGASDEILWTAVALLDVGYFERQLDSVRYRPDIRVELLVGGTPLLSALGVPIPLKRMLSVQRPVAGPFFRSAQELSVHAAGDAKAVFAVWNSRMLSYSILFWALVVLSLGMLALLQRRQEKFEARERENAERLRMAHEAAELGVWEYSVKNKQMTWDNAMFRLHGVEAQDYTDSTAAWQDTLLAEDRPLAEAFLKEVGQIDHTHSAKLRFKKNDGVRIFRTMAKSFPGRDGSCERIVGIHQDVTQSVEDQRHLKQLNWDLKQRTAEAEAASRSKSQFLANISHEIRTPMNAVLGLLLILAKTGLNTRQRDYVKKIESAGRYLLNLLNDVLDFSKAEAGKIVLEQAPFALHDTLRDVGALLGTMVNDKKVEIIFDASPTLPAQLLGDSLRLRQILLNLGGNAVKFTDEGHVVVGVEEASRTDDCITLRFFVADTGIGIAQDKLEDIFQGFVQAEASTTRRYGGSGLGLSICKFLIEKMGGELRVESRLGQGSRFSFELKLGRLAGDVETPVRANRLGSQRFLVADESSQSLYVLAKLIGHLGWTAETAETAARVLSRLKDTSSPTIDVVLVDAKLLEGGDVGWTTVLSYLSHSGRPPALVVTHGVGRDAPTPPEGSRSWDGQLTKPITPSALVDLVEGLNASNQEVRDDTGPQRLAGYRILVVEDHPVNRLVAQELLEKEGARVVLAPGGRAALTELERGSFDCVLMDIQMPEMDGFEATRLIRAKYGKELFIIAVTANAMPSDRAACLNAGMNNHVGKPLELEVLVQTILRGKPVKTTSSLDLESALARLNHDEALFRKVVAGVLAASDGLVEELREAGPETPDLARRIHTLKGFAATVGATRLADQARLVEADLAEGSRHSLPILLDGWFETRPALVQYLSSEPEKEVDHGPVSR